MYFTVLNQTYRQESKFWFHCGRTKHAFKPTNQKNLHGESPWQFLGLTNLTFIIQVARWPTNLDEKRPREINSHVRFHQRTWWTTHFSWAWWQRCQGSMKSNLSWCQWWQVLGLWTADHAGEDTGHSDFWACTSWMSGSLYLWPVIGPCLTSSGHSQGFWNEQR